MINMVPVYVYQIFDAISSKYTQLEYWLFKKGIACLDLQNIHVHHWTIINARSYCMNTFFKILFFLYAFEDLLAHLYV